MPLVQLIKVVEVLVNMHWRLRSQTVEMRLVQ